MTYYKVKPEHDNVKLLRYSGKYWYYDGILVGNELYTEKELVKRRILTAFGVHPGMFERVEISRKKIYWFFGARFAMEGNK